MNRRGIVAVAALCGVAAAGITPALASPAKHKPKPLKGTWSYTDATPDPTVDASSNTGNHCHGQLPSAPSDVNAHPLKAVAPGTLTVLGNVVGDWAMEVRDAKGNVVAGDDANPPAQEGVVVRIKKGTYQVVLCNLSGSPTATAKYAFKPR